jgi:hypothetical protein
LFASTGKITGIVAARWWITAAMASPAFLFGAARMSGSAAGV